MHRTLRAGVVVIGRNEGERLKNCIHSLETQIENIVYVDSGSSDQSIAFCRSLGIQIVELDDSAAFTAARARNEGMQWLFDNLPEIEYVYFFDGDCKVSPSWPARSMEILSGAEDLAIVCGQRKEINPSQSIYNTLCQIEWDTKIGIVKECGGDFLARKVALQEVGGFDSGMIAGEEPDLCYRLRKKGWKIQRIDAEMTLHDANITRFSQWWKRTFRSGYAYANNLDHQWDDNKSTNIRNLFSIYFWGWFLPATVIIFIAIGQWWLTVIAFSLYILMILRVAFNKYRENRVHLRESIIFGIFTILGKSPQGGGMLKYLLQKFGTREPKIIEYK